MAQPQILSIDQGTTSTRAVVFDAAGGTVASRSVELDQIYPANGWVEHDALEIWRATLSCCLAAMKEAGEIVAIGVTNQRETSVVWERASGNPICNAIVWQDRRTADRCRELKARGLEDMISARTGLLLDPYFSATKLEWILNRVAGARARAEAGELCFGTIDSWLIYKLTNGKVHATDATNASRTMLLDLKSLSWDADLRAIFGVPGAMLPEVRDSAGDFGTAEQLGGVPIRGVAGDQQAAAFGQACFRPGEVKSTYGTGCFALVNTGATVPASKNRLLATSAFRIGAARAYAIEGSIFTAGAVVQWLRDALGVIRSASDIEALAATAAPADGLYFVPAFTGLGAPYWDPDARAAIFGLTRDMGAAEIARAALDAVCYQTRDLLEAMGRDMRSVGLGAPSALKVDGGMVRNDWFCQRLADLTGLVVDRPVVTETTALGAAYLAGLASGLFRDLGDIAARWALDRRFEPAMNSTTRDTLYEGWKAAVARVMG